MFIRPASVPGTEVIAAYQSSRRWHVFHERYAFCACRSAASGVRYRGVEDRVDDGNVVVREPGETLCNTFVAKPAAFKMLFVAPSLVDEARLGGGSLRTFALAPRAITGDPDLFAQLGAYALDRSGDRSAGATISVRGDHGGARATCRTQDRAAASGKAGRAVERAKAYGERFNESISLTELATACRTQSLPPGAYVHQGDRPVAPCIPGARADRALAQPFADRNPASRRRGEASRFADQSHFTRHFKRIIHVTPTKYASLGPVAP